MWATYKGRSTTVKMLIARGADINAHGNFHISSLLWAAGRGYSEIVKELIAHGAKVNVGDKVNYQHWERISIWFFYFLFLSI